MWDFCRPSSPRWMKSTTSWIMSWLLVSWMDMEPRFSTIYLHILNKHSVTRDSLNMNQPSDKPDLIYVYTYEIYIYIYLLFVSPNNNSFISRFGTEIRGRSCWQDEESNLRVQTSMVIHICFYSHASFWNQPLPVLLVRTPNSQCATQPCRCSAACAMEMKTRNLGSQILESAVWSPWMKK